MKLLDWIFKYSSAAKVEEIVISDQEKTEEEGLKPETEVKKESDESRYT